MQQGREMFKNGIYSITFLYCRLCPVGDVAGYFVVSDNCGNEKIQLEEGGV